VKKPSILSFQKTIWGYYKKHGRKFPWRFENEPYKILISEIMLQQTQTHRVLPKYLSFIKKFPTLQKLAKATHQEVLTEWKGLGYNRRGKALHTIAKMLVRSKKSIPKTVEELDDLPSIGPHTAASIAAFAYNSPTVFIETNIRTVFIHFFFRDQGKVSDKEIMILVEKNLPAMPQRRGQAGPREWYYALMDYGVYLKKSGNNLNKKSIHYRKQSAFKGSNRELRSKILDTIRDKPTTLKSLEKLHPDKEKIYKNLNDLQKEGFIVASKTKRYTIKI
jgi:A/G-specific adenine glycosylase